MEIWAVVYNCCGCPDPNIDSLWTKEDWAQDRLADINPSDRKHKDYGVARFDIATEPHEPIFGGSDRPLYPAKAVRQE